MNRKQRMKNRATALALTYAVNPCAIEHDMEFVDDSFDHEFGTERIFYMRCVNCGHQEDCEPYDD